MMRMVWSMTGFYVRQGGMFNASIAYKGITNWFMGGPSDEIHYYIGSYKMNNWMDGMTQQDSGVSLMDSSPQNENSSATVTSGVSVTIGGKVGYSKGSTADVSAGVTISNSKSFVVKDCKVVNNSNNQVNNANWSYSFDKAMQINQYGYSR